MLQLRPNCEHCNCALPPQSTDAMICSFECTFCRDCVDTILQNVCPNCGGGFCQRPIRPQGNYVDGVNLQQFPATTKSTLKPLNVKKHQLFAADIRHIAPDKR